MGESTQDESAHLDIEVPALLEGVRLDRAVAMLTGISRAEASRLVNEGRVTVAEEAVRQRSFVLVSGTRLSIDLLDPNSWSLSREPDVEVPVVHVDDNVIVVNKPAGMVVHPGAGHRRGTLIGGLLAEFPDLADLCSQGVCEPERPGIVHRLDKGTSGLLVLARNADAYRSLVAQLADRTMERRYLALVHEHLSDDRGIVDAPIGRSARAPTRMAITNSGRQAKTSYRVLLRTQDPVPSTLVALSLETGRTHQIRVHMSAIGHPVLGDISYRGTNARSPSAKGPMTHLEGGRLFLHAFQLSFDHPQTGQRVSWLSPLPADLSGVLEHGVDVKEVSQLLDSQGTS